VQGPLWIAGVTETLRDLLLSELSGGVEVTTVSPARAHATNAAGSGPARVNLALVHVGASPHLRNLALRAPGRTAKTGDPDDASPPELVFLVTAQGAGGPSTELPGWSLLELAMRALRARPFLELATGSHVRASVVPVDASRAELEGLWRALRTELRPAVLLAVHPVGAHGADPGKGPERRVRPL
jgi:hypothetical protein